MSDSESAGDLNKCIWSWEPPTDPRAGALLITVTGAPLNFYLYDDSVSKQRLENIILTYGGSVCCDIVETYTVLLVNENFKPPDNWGPCYSRNFIKDCVESFNIKELNDYLIPGCTPPSCESSLSAALYFEKFNFRPKSVPISFYSGVPNTVTPCKMLPTKGENQGSNLKSCYGDDHEKTDRPEALNLVYKYKAPEVIYGRFCQCRKQFFVSEGAHDTNSDATNLLTEEFDSCMGELQQNGTSRDSNVTPRKNNQSTLKQTENKLSADALLLLLSSPDCYSDSERESSTNMERVKKNINRLGCDNSSNQGLVCEDGISKKPEETVLQNKNLNSCTSNDVDKPMSDIAEEIPRIVILSCKSLVHKETDNVAQVQISKTLNTVTCPDNSAQGGSNQEIISKVGEYSTPKKNSLSTFSPSCKISPIVSRAPSTTSNCRASNKNSKQLNLEIIETAAENSCKVNKLEPVKNLSDRMHNQDLLDKRSLNDEVAGPSNLESEDECSLLAPFQNIKKGKQKRLLPVQLDLINVTREDTNSTRLSAPTETEKEKNVPCPNSPDKDSDDDFPNVKSWKNNLENKHTNRKYTRKEKSNIIRYIVAKKAYTRLKSDALYREMEERNICPRRTYQSMKNHFIKTLLNELDTFEFLTDKIKQKLRRDVW